MADQLDFERAWLGKLSSALDELAGQDVREVVMRGSVNLTSASPRADVISWTQSALQRLEARVDAEAQRQIMARCACQYSRADLQEVRRRYRQTNDVQAAHQMLQARFEHFLRQVLQLEQALIEDVVARGWGLAGILEGDRIVATKIPKSGSLRAYLAEEDPARRRALYCHCPRIRDLLKGGETLPETYCYCGAGFYQGIWEEITQAPVEVEVLESVLAGGETCRIAIYLSPD
ncbi:MAG: hypothetical protein PVI59_01750 [Anaerolineae bacterium]|jgi:hypothetical protein